MQLQRRQTLAVAKDEVVDKGVVGFGLRVSRLGLHRGVAAAAGVTSVAATRNVSVKPRIGLRFMNFSKLRSCICKVLARSVGKPSALLGCRW